MWFHKITKYPGMPINGVGNAESSFGGGGNAEQAAATLRKRDLIKRTLSEDYPGFSITLFLLIGWQLIKKFDLCNSIGLDYLGFHNVLHAKRKWYCVLWFTMVIVCLLIGLYTIYGFGFFWNHTLSYICLVFLVISLIIFFRVEKGKNSVL